MGFHAVALTMLFHSFSYELRFIDIYGAHSQAAHSQLSVLKSLRPIKIINRVAGKIVVEVAVEIGE